MENVSVKQVLNNIMVVLRNWSFWQKILSLILLPIAVGLLTYYLIILKVYWFAAISFMVGIIYFLIALMFNIADKDFEIKLPGGWISIRKHDDEK